jgi:O-6-methylguanine DNA methyltransferase
MRVAVSKNKSSSFKELVYEVVRKIPLGKTMTYKEVAKAVGNPRSYRAVGNVLNKNYDKKIPCHRVVRSDGAVGGYNRGKSNKVIILKREGVKL